MFLIQILSEEDDDPFINFVRRDMQKCVPIVRDLLRVHYQHLLIHIKYMDQMSFIYGYLIGHFESTYTSIYYNEKRKYPNAEQYIKIYQIIKNHRTEIEQIIREFLSSRF